MSNVFAAFAQVADGAIPLDIGVSAIPAGANQGLRTDDVGNIYAEEDGVITHYAQGLPFTDNGRLAVTRNPPVRWEKGVPFAANDHVAFGDFGPPVVNAILRTEGGTCAYPAAGTCRAQSIFQGYGSSGELPPLLTAVWAVDNGAIIVSGQGTASITVDGPDGDTDVSYNVSLTLTNSKGSTQFTKMFTDTKEQA